MTVPGKVTIQLSGIGSMGAPKTALQISYFVGHFSRGGATRVVNNHCHLSFSYFEFKIRLIRLGLSFQKPKFLYSNSQSTDSQSEVITITPKSQL